MNMDTSAVDFQKMASSLRKGCRVHFLNSVQRVNKNYSIVGRDDNGEFLRMVTDAADEPMEQAFHAAMEVLQVKMAILLCFNCRLT
jgi:hypothetical protein